MLTVARSGRYGSGTLWQPRSDCGPDCLPGPEQVGTVSAARRAGRLAALVGALLFGALLLPVLPVLPASGRWFAGRAWARTVLRALGVELLVRGRVPRRRVLLVANHISWLDIVAVLAITPARLLAKHEVRGWPLIGALAAAGGTIFVNRTRPRDLPDTVRRIADVLRADGVVATFPEGTTWCGVVGCPAGCGCGSSGRFRPAVFQAAIDAGALVVPLTLRYQTGRSSDATTTAAAFLGDDTLWASVRRVIAVRKLVVCATATAALHPEPAADRRRLARAAESAVRLAAPRPAVGTPPAVPVPPAVPAPSAPAEPVPPAAGEVLDLAA
ncbi:lysophospholipid acyltransferase family protein [Micromonospora sp. NPDC049559]|uniref:lysophospholipid acyltransferase family protein n=1 Tax=Micromonospora sp. NPDC049559 TaxID=3155923 RepID=UPI00341A4E72